MSLTFAPGRVAFVTGGARGQGRAHAVALAEHGVRVALVDVCEGFETVPYKHSTKEDLAETVRLIEEAGSEALPFVADVRNFDALKTAADETAARFGTIDYLVANAGIWSMGGKTDEIPEATWQEMIDVNLTGVWHAMKATLPHMLAQGFGRIVATTSGTVRHTGMHVAHYAAAKAGVYSLVKSVAIEYADRGITANSISPSNVGTDMILNDYLYRVYAPDLENPTLEDIEPRFAGIHATGIGYIQPADVAKSVVFLLSDESRYTTGEEFPILFGRQGGV
ncbi:mycofactocin-coupled SDR family oxidoreductase [Pseudonocardia ailaonensis]